MNAHKSKLKQLISLKEKVPGYNTMVIPYHFSQAILAGSKNHFPGKKMRVIGVTGTNGKTTTCFMIWKMLSTAGKKVGLMTTVAWGAPEMTADFLKANNYQSDILPDQDGLIKQIEHMTTADSFTLNRRMYLLSKLGCEYLVLEVTSHALSQFRTLGIPIEIAVMTNVTHEHLDYHKSFSRYVEAKTRLFKKAKFGIINSDDPSHAAFIQAMKSGDYITYGIKYGKNRAKTIELAASGVNYSFCDMNISTQIPGEFNVYNSMACALVGQKLGLSKQAITSGIAALNEVEGRMNRLQLGQKFEVIVDFAHTPDAFEKVFSSVKAPAKNGRIISLFGGAGRRDESTRSERGEIAGKYSDFCILTEDDSRDEDPEKIMEMFREGCKKSGMKDTQIITEKDRKKAIEKAIKMAKAGDLVLILGKGHEKTILRADGAHPFEDLKVTKAALEKLLKK